MPGPTHASSFSIGSPTKIDNGRLSDCGVDGCSTTHAASCAIRTWRPWHTCSGRAPSSAMSGMRCSAGYASSTTCPMANRSWNGGPQAGNHEDHAQGTHHLHALDPPDDMEATQRMCIQLRSPLRRYSCRQNQGLSETLGTRGCDRTEALPAIGMYTRSPPFLLLGRTNIALIVLMGQILSPC